MQDKGRQSTFSSGWNLALIIQVVQDLLCKLGLVKLVVSQNMPESYRSPYAIIKILLCYVTRQSCKVICLPLIYVDLNELSVAWIESLTAALETYIVFSFFSCPRLIMGSRNWEDTLSWINKNNGKLSANIPLLKKHKTKQKTKQKENKQRGLLVLVKQSDILY